jgi:hypothetical protein
MSAGELHGAEAGVMTGVHHTHEAGAPSDKFREAARTVQSTGKSSQSRFNLLIVSERTGRLDALFTSHHALEKAQAEEAEMTS